MTGKVTGYRIRIKHKGTSSICTDCADAIHLNTSPHEKLTTGKFASFYCTVCEKDITNGDNLGEIDYPTAICVLLDGKFDSVYPRIDNQAEKNEIAPGVTVSEPIRTSYDPVIFEIYNDEPLRNQVVQMLDTMMQRGRIQYREEEVDVKDGIKSYWFTVFAVQS